MKKERILFYARMIPLCILLCISLLFPYIIGAVMCVILDATIITMIASAIIRYIRQKHRIEK